MQAVALEHRLGRVVLPSCHGAWTLGGVDRRRPDPVDRRRRRGRRSRWWRCCRSRSSAAPFLPRDHGEAATTTETDVPWRAIVTGRAGARRLLHRRHRGRHVGTGLPRRRLRRSRGAGRPGDPALPAGQRPGPARRRRSDRAGRRGAAPAGRGGGRPRRARTIVVAAPSWPVAVAGLHAARLRRGGGGAAELLGGGGARRSRRRPGDPAGPGRRRGGAVQPVQLRRRPARRRHDGRRRRQLAEGRLRRAARARGGPVLAGQGLRAGGRGVRRRPGDGARRLRPRRRRPCGGASAWRRSCR